MMEGAVVGSGVASAASMVSMARLHEEFARLKQEAWLRAATAGQPAVTSEDGGGTMELEARSPVVAIATKSLSQAQTARLVAAEDPTTPGWSVHAIFGAWTLALSWASYNMYHMCGCIESKLAGVASGASTTCSILLLLNTIIKNTNNSS